MSNRRESLRNTPQGSAASPRGSSNLSTGSSSSSSRYNEPETEEDILNSVSKIYFQDVQGSNEMTTPTKGGSSAAMNNGIDLVEFVLTQPTLDLSDEASILTELNKQEKVLGVVNHRLGKTVMNNYNSFVEGMTNVQEVGADLNMTSLMCKNGRKRLKKAHENLVHGGLMIVALYRKKKSLKTLEYYLGRIKEIVDKDKEMNQLLEEGNFPNAIALMLDHRQSVVSMNQFSCVQQLDRNIKNVYQRMEQKMKESLLSVCAQFDPIAYERILIASKELSSGEISVDIKKNYNDAVEQLLREVVLSFAMQSPKAQNIESIVKMDYANLCKKIHFDHVLASLLRALSTVSDIMYNYYQMYCWHLQKEKDKDETLKSYDFSITKTNLNQFRKTLWDNIQKKISIFLSACDLSHFKIDKFLQVFHSINMICHLGEEFSESDSYHLKGALKTKSRSYFVHYHKDILENIKTMVENENWQQLESVSFSVNDIPEFRTKSNSALDSIENIYEEYSKKVRGFLKSNDRDSNPFKLAFEKGSFLLTVNAEEEEEPVDDESSESSESSEDEDDDFIKKKETKPKKKKKDVEVYTNISMTMLRRIGVYIQAMEIIQPIGLDIFFAFTTLYKFYLYTVYTLFANISSNTVSSTTINLEEAFTYPENDTKVSEALQKTFKTIREELNRCVKEATNGEVTFFKIPQVSQMINIKQPPFFGLYERAIAAESLTHLFNAIEKITEKRMMELIPKKSRAYVTQFLKSMKAATEEVQECIYGRTVKYLLFDFPYMEKYPDKIANCKYQIQVLGDQCNKFVFELRDDIKKFFSIKLQTMDDRLPEHSIHALWDVAIKYVVDLLVEGFARVKKCNNEGRVLMQLDLQTLTTELQKMVPASLIEENKGYVPHVAVARSYISAYYEQSESDLLEWVKKNVHNFTIKQLVAIANNGIGVNMKKNDLKQLTSQIEQLATSLKMQKEHNELIENSSDESLMNNFSNGTGTSDPVTSIGSAIPAIHKEEQSTISMIRSGSFASTKELLSSLTRSTSSTTISKDSTASRTSTDTLHNPINISLTNSPSTSRTSIDAASRPSLDKPKDTLASTTDKMKTFFQGGMNYLKRNPTNTPPNNK